MIMGDFNVDIFHHGPQTLDQAVANTSDQLIDKETVVRVQMLLLSKGYYDGGPADGVLSQKTQDEILSFRSRNNLPITPVIDHELLEALERAPPKALPIEQVTATKDDIKPRVEIVAVADRVQSVAWHSKLWAFITGIPTGLFTIIAAIISQIDNANAFIRPLQNLLFNFGQIPGWFWVVAVLVVAGVFAYQAHVIAKLSKQIEEKAVEGYQRGTIKNDAPPTEY